MTRCDHRSIAPPSTGSKLPVAPGAIPGVSRPRISAHWGHRWCGCCFPWAARAGPSRLAILDCSLCFFCRPRLPLSWESSPSATSGSTPRGTAWAGPIFGLKDLRPGLIPLVVSRGSRAKVEFRCAGFSDTPCTTPTLVRDRCLQRSSQPNRPAEHHALLHPHAATVSIPVSRKPQRAG